MDKLPNGLGCGAEEGRTAPDAGTGVCAATVLGSPEGLAAGSEVSAASEQNTRAMSDLETAKRALWIVVDILAERGFKSDSSARHNLSIALSCIGSAQSGRGLKCECGHPTCVIEQASHG